MSGERDAAPHARFAARTAGLRAAHLRRTLVIFGGVALTLVLVWLVAFSPVFAVRSVAVAGAPGDLAGQVRARADDAIGTPMVRADTAAIDRSVRQLPRSEMWTFLDR